jgi:CubicO group peptidase (beta-lactamase class C family)
MEKLQFQVLYRQFLLRMVDLELLSADARGDSTKLFGQFASLLVFASVGLSAGVLAFSGRTPPPALLNLSWVMEHFLIATTMLVVGLFAVLSWDSTYPDRRDVMVLAPLPVRVRTLFFAKVASVGAALGLTVLMLHCMGGLVWPLTLGVALPEQSVPSLSFDRAMPPVDAASMQSVLDLDIAPALRPGGAIGPETGGGAAIALYQHGVRRVFAYGAVKPDSIFEIASVSKTFTALVLARMIAEGTVQIDQPVRELLPSGTVARPRGPEITLLDLATHHSGLPGGPGNIRDDANRELDYSPAELFAYLGKHGVAKPPQTAFGYSNLGFALLGQALTSRAGMTYGELLRQSVTAPLHLRDTDVTLDSEQSARFVKGHSGGRAIAPWDFDAQAPAGGIRSSAGDLLTYLEAYLHPDRFPSSLGQALRETQVLRAPITVPVATDTGVRIGLGWWHGAQSGMYFHQGEAPGQTSCVLFDPVHDYAIVALANIGPQLIDFPELLAHHIRRRLIGEPALALDSVRFPATRGFLALPRIYLAYWFTMLTAGGFVFGAILAVQGLAAQLLPRRLLLRASSLLQMAVLCLVLGVYFLQPMFVQPEVLLRAQGSGPLAWSPSYWFLGLFHQLNGEAVFSILARRAWLGLAIVGIVTTTVYALSYLRTLRKIVEEPDIVPGVRTAGWMPPFGPPRLTALVHFSARTLLRSRKHRVLLGFYLGLGFAIMIFLLSARSTRDVMTNVADPWRQVNLPMLSSAIVIMCAWVMGTRVVFAMPIDLRANWIFRVTPVQGGRDCITARRRALLLLSVAPVCLACAALFLSLWPWKPAAGCVLVLALVGAILAELSLAGPQKIPFTCSYLPGKSQVHLRFWFCAWVLMQILNQGSEYLRTALESFSTYAVLATILTVALAAARWRNREFAAVPLEFEDSENPTVQQLGLYRDGVLPLEPPPPVIH